MLALLTSKWFWIAVAFAGLATWGVYEHNEVQDLTIAIEKQKDQAAQDLAKATAAVAAKEAENAKLSMQMDAEHDEHQKALDSAHSDNQRLLDSIKRLQLAQSGSGSRGERTLSVGGATPGLVADGTAAVGRPTSCEDLLAEGAELLVGIASQSDDATEYAGIAHSYALKLSQPQ